MFLYLATFIKFLLSSVYKKLKGFSQGRTSAVPLTIEQMYVVSVHGFQKQSALDTVASCHLNH